MGLTESIDIKLRPRGGDFAVHATAYAERKVLFCVFLCTNMFLCKQGCMLPAGFDMRYFPQGKVIRHFPLSNPHRCPTNPLLRGLTLIGALDLEITRPCLRKFRGNIVASTPEVVAVSKYSLAYWLFHAITFKG